MKPKITQGGFISLVDCPENIQSINILLNENGFNTAIVNGLNLLVGVIEEFDGQGLWFGDAGGIVYDVDLTNHSEVAAILGNAKDDAGNQGRLIWQLYKKKGIDFLMDLRGAFAFTLWDAVERKIITVTDPIGIRPIVFCCHGASFAAASRIRHLLFHPEVDTTINPDAIYHYLFFDAIPSPVCIYNNIFKLEPGNAVVFDLSHLKKHRYFDIQYNTDYSKSEFDWIETIPQAIRSAVANHAANTEPEKTGCFLSGGTDSSSVTGYYGQITGKPVKTFSIGFDDVEYNELDYAHIASKAFGTVQTDYYVTPVDVLHLVEKIAHIYDEPFGNSSVIPAFFCSKVAAEAGVDTLLGGDGGDEVFGGNERYAKNLIFELYGKIPQFLRKRILEPVIDHLNEIPVVYRAGRYIRRSNIPNPDRFYSYNLLYENDADAIFNLDFLSQIDESCFLNMARHHYQHASATHVTDKLMYLDMKFTITDNDLRKVTQMAESAGVKVRYPLLDLDLLAFAATIPPTLKVRLGRERYIFKRAMKGFLPDAIIKKKKHGMGLPIANWFKTDKDLVNLLYDNLFSADARIKTIVRPDFIDMMRKAFKEDETPYYGSNFWVFLILELWLRNNES